MNLAELKQRYVVEGRPLPAALERALRADGRKGAAAILAAVAKRRRENRAEGQRLRRMLSYERPLWAQDLTQIAGVDEAGMSPLAGPVVAAAVILAPGTRIREVDDSKRLDAATRARLAEVIKADALAWATGTASVEEIDSINIYHAGLLAMRRAVTALPVTPDHALVDARTLPELTCAQTSIVKGDQKSLSIAAASILAKTTRDALMCQLDTRYPAYGFARHKGYGVAEHQTALRRHGVTPAHRRSFAAVREALSRSQVREY